MYVPLNLSRLPVRGNSDVQHGTDLAEELGQAAPDLLKFLVSNITPETQFEVLQQDCTTIHQSSQNKTN